MSFFFFASVGGRHDKNLKIIGKWAKMASYWRKCDYFNVNSKLFEIIRLFHRHWRRKRRNLWDSRCWGWGDHCRYWRGFDIEAELGGLKERNHFHFTLQNLKQWRIFGEKSFCSFWRRGRRREDVDRAKLVVFCNLNFSWSRCSFFMRWEGEAWRSKKKNENERMFVYSQWNTVKPNRIIQDDGKWKGS